MDGKELAKKTLDQIPQANANAKRIVGLVKEGGRITGYQLSDNSVVEKQQAVNMAKQGQIAGVGIAHRGNTEYFKSIPDGSENNNLGNLPSVSPNTQGYGIKIQIAKPDDSGLSNNDLTISAAGKEK